MTYAYVTTETCRIVSAEKRGALIGRDERPVSRHGDYAPWQYGKRETLAILRDIGTPIYRYHAAKRVAELLGWESVAE